MPTLVINRCLSLDRDRTTEIISEHIRGPIRIFNVCGIKDERACDLFYNIIFLDPVTTRHFSKFQLMFLHHWSRSSPFQEWWAAFRSYTGQMVDNTHDQMSNWRRDNRRAFRDQVDHSNPQTTSSGKVKRTCECFYWSGSNDGKAKKEPPICWQYKSGNFRAGRSLIWDDITDADDDDENWVDLGAPNGGRSCPSNGNDTDDSVGEEGA
jgi:hypothetical protein